MNLEYVTPRNVSCLSMYKSLFFTLLLLRGFFVFARFQFLWVIAVWIAHRRRWIWRAWRWAWAWTSRRWWVRRVGTGIAELNMESTFCYGSDFFFDWGFLIWIYFAFCLKAQPQACSLAFSYHSFPWLLLRHHSSLRIPK